MHKDGLVAGLRGWIRAWRSPPPTAPHGLIAVEPSTANRKGVRLVLRPQPEAEPATLELTSGEAKRLARQLRRMTRTASTPVEQTAFIPAPLLDEPLSTVIDMLRTMGLKASLIEADTGQPVDASAVGDDRVVAFTDPAPEQAVSRGTVVTIALR